MAPSIPFTKEFLRYSYIILHYHIGPSGVRALPLAAGINVGGHYFRYFSSYLVVVVVTTVIKTPQGVVVGFQILAWAPK